MPYSFPPFPFLVLLSHFLSLSFPSPTFPSLYPTPYLQYFLPTHPVISGDWIKQEIIGENLSASKFSSLLPKLKFSQKYFAFTYTADNIKIAYLFLVQMYLLKAFITMLWYHWLIDNILMKY
jgi:hypothetical protein